MSFAKDIKNIRISKGLSQQEFAEKLYISRQAVSNWENDHNLPDIEMLIKIAEIFQISLDDLILGGKQKNNMTEKLIRDGSENRRTRNNLISISIAAGLFIVGLGLIIIKALSVEYIDESGILHENFFLIPMAAISFFSGFVIFAITGIRNIIIVFKAKKEIDRTTKITTVIALIVVVVFLILFGLIVLSNSGKLY